MLYNMFTNIKDALATTASICTVLQFLAGTLVCRKFIKNETTGDTSGFTFVTCYLSCSLWLKYGFLIGDSFLVLVNVFGSILQVCYVVVYALYSVKKSVIVKQFLIATCFLVFVYLYSMYETDRELAIKRVGLLCCSFTTLFFASPFIMLAHVIKVQSAESLPLPVIVASLIVSCQWFAYGCLLDDQFIQIPNFLGCVLCLLQLCLFLVYRNKQVNHAYLI